MIWLKGCKVSSKVSSKLIIYQIYLFGYYLSPSTITGKVGEGFD